ncbi:CoxG family protein [Ramlibacter sp. WS9]|uniref:CoxG family protein n=1 Tax=Ramlibacter sp. WS9 TaxID=1882741 RepID=UPI001143DE21|nr:carbon monoxide dehydrogenase subunit G [Ramlibacter sp. WS9]ROZ69395.1 carbon monoxide dehydrogenase [Ramlibacter sp. WS9]
MEMQGSRVLAVTQQQAWEALNDPEVLKASIPGCDKVESTGENQYAVGVAVKIGPVAAKFQGKITLTDVQPPESYTLSFDGQGGAAGFGKGQAQVKLTPQGTGCELAYSARAQVGGKIAQLGQRLIDGVARSMAEDFFKRFDEEMQRRYPQAYAMAAAEAAAQPQPPSAAPPTAGVPVWVWIAAAVVLGVVVWLMR